MHKKVFLFFLFILLKGNVLWAQVTPIAEQPVLNDRYVQIIKADIFRRVKRDSAGDLNILKGNVIMQQQNTLIYCDSAVQNVLLNQVETFGNIHINDNDSVHAYSQYMQYMGDTKVATLKKRVKLTDGKGVLTTEALEYNVGSNIGTYLNNGKVVNGESVLTSKEGIYYANTRDVFFQKRVKLVDPEYTMTTETLRYNLNTEIANFLAPTIIKDERSTIKTRRGMYDLKKGKAIFTDRPEIRDSTQLVYADSIAYDKITGAGKAIGNVEYRDSAQGIAMFAGATDFNNDSKTVTSYYKPLLVLKQKNDSLFVTADTLHSAYLQSDSTKAKNPADTIRYFTAFHHVRLFSDSLQSKCDSLYYSGIDSVFRFFAEPVIWTQGSQISGDTIFLATKNRKAEKINVNENAFTINRTADGMFNQMKGNELTGQFIEGSIDFLRVKGNGENLYYLQDEDSAYVGVNYTMADAIVMRFANKELKRVTWFNSVTGTTYPVMQLPEDKKELRNFKWLETIRPKSVKDIWEDWDKIQKPLEDSIKLPDEEKKPLKTLNSPQKSSDKVPLKSSGDKPKKNNPIKTPIRKES
jgi:lipopolysaccharide export system protein LptA